MQALAITPIYAGILALLYLFLAASVIRQRRRRGISVGDGGDAAFMRIIRAHGNFAEYVPITLILMAFAELLGTKELVLHVIGGLLLTGRLSHAWCFLFTTRNLRARVAGMVLTFSSIAIGAIACLWVSLIA
ncbi:MAG: MAPEG family protein [Alphaproteobacteria bacterium]|nr:MAPEG family protein [Alphaproteobacteria bacterium]